MNIPTTSEQSAQASAKKPAGHLVIYGLAAFLIGSLLLLIAVRPLYITHDSAVFLYIGRLLLNGGLPYVDYLESNLPLIHYLSVIPVWAATLLKVNPIPVFSVMIVLLTLYSAVVSARLLALAPVEHDVFPAILGVGIVLATLTTYTYFEFGQREHIFTLLVFPALVLRWLRWSRYTTPAPWAAALVGVMGAVGACIKPHFFLIVVATEAYWLLATRNFRPLLAPEVLGFVLFGGLFALHFFLLPAPSREAFFRELLPAVTGGHAGYRAYTLPRMVYMALPLFVAGGLPWLLRGAAQDRVVRLMRALSAFTLVAALMFVWQRKGWTYQAIPARSGAIVIGLLFVEFMAVQGGFLKGLEINWKRVWHAALVGVVLVIWPLWFSAMLAFIDRRGDDTAEIKDWVVGHTVEGEAILFIDTKIDYYVELMQINRYQASRYLLAYPVPYALSAPSSEQTGHILADYLAQLEDDIEARQPTLILISQDDPCFSCPLGTTLPGVLAEYGFFNTPAMADYTQVGTAREYLVYSRVVPR